MLIEALTTVVIVVFLICMIPLIASTSIYLLLGLVYEIREEWRNLRRGY